MSTSLLFKRTDQDFGKSRGIMALKDNLVRLRSQAGLSQAKLARKVGVQQNTIAALETGESKRSRYLPDIARALGCSVDDLDPPPATANLAAPPEALIAILEKILAEIAAIRAAMERQRGK